MKSASRIACAALVLICLGVFLEPAVVAQNSKKDAQLRTVHGTVLDSAENNAPGAVVFLRNTRNNDVRSYIANDGGEYRFAGLDPNADYDIHAEKDGAKSPSHTVSSFDSRKDIVLNLKLGKKRS